MIFRKVSKAGRDLAAEAFYHGSQGVGPDNNLAQIDALHGAARERVRRDRIAEIKNLEAKRDAAGRDAERAEARWKELGPDRPAAGEWLLPVLALAATLVAVAGEMILLAPVMDGLGIADPALQFVAASALMLVSAAFFGATVRRVLHPPDAAAIGARLETAAVATLAILALVFSATLGYWRAEELIFAGSLGGGALSHFLASVPGLTRLLLSLCTLGLPIAAALLVEWGAKRMRASIERLRARIEWSRVARARDDAPKRLDEAARKIEAAYEALEREMAEIDALRLEQRGFYFEHYDLGRRIGARRTPFREVAVKIAAAGLLALLAAWLLGDPLVAEYVAEVWLRVVVAVTAAAAFAALFGCRELRRWDRPTPRRISAERAVIWRGERDTLDVVEASSFPRVASHGDARVEARSA